MKVVIAAAIRFSGAREVGMVKKVRSFDGQTSKLISTSLQEEKEIIVSSQMKYGRRDSLLHLVVQIYSPIQGSEHGR